MAINLNFKGKTLFALNSAVHFTVVFGFAEKGRGVEVVDVDEHRKPGVVFVLFCFGARLAPME